MNFKQGIRDGIPIGLGYAAVSFAFGILAVDKDLTVSEAVLISFTNLTSAGQFAGLTIIAELGTLVEMALSQFIINLRYMLMAISLSQKVDDDFSGIWRWILGFAITDEIFAVAIQNPGKIKRNYFAGLTIVPIIGWTIGTFDGKCFTGHYHKRFRCRSLWNVYRRCRTKGKRRQPCLHCGMYRNRDQYSTEIHSSICESLRRFRNHHLYRSRITYCGNIIPSGGKRR